MFNLVLLIVNHLLLLAPYRLRFFKTFQHLFVVNFKILKLHIQLVMLLYFSVELSDFCFKVPISSVQIRSCNVTLVIRCIGQINIEDLTRHWLLKKVIRLHKSLLRLQQLALKLLGLCSVFLRSRWQFFNYLNNWVGHSHTQGIDLA